MLDRPYSVSGTAARIAVSVRSLLLVPDTAGKALRKSL